MNNLIKVTHQYFTRHSYLLVAAIVAFTIITLLLTLLPSKDVTLPSGMLSHDKLGHFLLFGVWTFLLGYHRFAVKPNHTNFIIIFIIGLIFGGCVEVLQGIMPFMRQPSIFDWAADAIGAFCAIVILYIISQNVNK
jgi:VanZ family protein